MGVPEQCSNSLQSPPPSPPASRPVPGSQTPALMIQSRCQSSSLMFLHQHPTPTTLLSQSGHPLLRLLFLPSYHPNLAAQLVMVSVLQESETALLLPPSHLDHPGAAADQCLTQHPSVTGHPWSRDLRSWTQCSRNTLNLQQYYPDTDRTAPWTLLLLCHHYHCHHLHCQDLRIHCLTPLHGYHQPELMLTMATCHHSLLDRK